MTKIKSIIILFVAAFCCNHAANAQYDFTFEIQNSADDSLILGFYYHGNMFARDTAVNNKNKFRFKNKKKTLDSGIYFITNNKGKLFEFIVKDEKNLRFVTSDDNWSKNVVVKGSKQEELYVDFHKKSQIFLDMYNDVFKSKDSLTKQELDDKIKLITAQNDSLKENFIEKNPDHLLSKILMSTKPIKIPETEIVYRTDGSIDSLKMRQNRFVWLKRHYFDNVDLSCDALLRTHKNVFVNNFNYYWDSIMQYEQIDTVLFYADYWIAKAKGKEMYNYFIHEITGRYLQDGVMGHDSIYVGMIDRYFKTGKYKGLSPSDMEKNIHRADVWSNLLIGKQIPNLACPVNDSESQWHHLDELKTKYKILLFWSVECSHCTVEVPKLSEWYDKYKDVYDLEVFAVHTEGDIAQMHDFVTKHNIKWISTNGGYANYDWRTYFDIEKTPVIYILDANDVILAKYISVDNIKRVMDILENGGFKL